MPFKIRKRESGIALVLVLLVLMILSAITATLVTMTGTETTVNANYRSEEMALFAARAGLYEVSDRMMQTNGSSISSTIMSGAGGPPFGAVIPSATNAGVVYLINQTSATGTVAPWDINNKYADTELCHEGYTIAGMSNATPDVACTTLPSGSTWYTTVNSNAPWNGTAAAMSYDWVRVSWKLNNSLSYLTATTTNGVTTTSTSTYSVNGTQTATSPVCWNGASEVVLTSGSSCNQLTTGGTADTPVFLLTSLSITSSGAREMVQTEVAAPPPTVVSTPAGFSDPDGFFAVSSICSASGGSSPFVLSGGATVDGYNSSNGGTYATTHSASLGSIGSNGSIVMSGSTTKVGGHVHTQHTVVNGSCGPPATSDLFTSGGASYGGVLAISPYTPPVPTIPAPGVANETIHGNTTLVPGSYNNIKVSSSGTVLTLTGPGVYNINCISLSGNSVLAISPASTQVVLNVTGNSCTSNAPVDLSGGTVTNTSGFAANLTVNYAGTQQVKLTGMVGLHHAVGDLIEAGASREKRHFLGAVVPVHGAFGASHLPD
jgi:Tfp pilus assembly protein PilX